MSELVDALSQLQAHDGVEHLILLGRDGLVIQHLNGAGTEETIAARIPGITSACDSLGAAAGLGRCSTAVLEFDRGVAVISALSAEIMLVALLRPAVGFAPLLRQMRRDRERLVALL